ncbi:septum site-determining protein MinC [Marinobacterium weihaiense]|uniref:Probable septum site-determining protein MinC n=1 Tax=Marinobacterium weihaiense TaxID=2851016 RepID=A0ABS6MA77_9GAMM|nr:septum site-determining protein MinC [Marinobacterium weihaiense]MBV0932809.1 septum site-determining protein MinC [Marinobacterium weihaiense]
MSKKMPMGHAVNQESNTCCFQFKSTRAALNELILSTSDTEQLQPQLAAHAAKVPMLFSNMPVVLNLQQLTSAPTLVELQALIRLCRELALVPVGLKADPETSAELCNVTQLADFSHQRRPVRDMEAAPEPVAAEPPAAPEQPSAPAAKVITTPVRSGQQVYARGTDLVILAPVSAGAEVMADGHIHVYGPLRGRAMAGVNGDTEARIFCQSMEAELISIAGYFKTSEDLHAECWQQPIQALLRGSRLDTVSL